MAEELEVKHDIVVSPEEPAASTLEIEAAAAAASAETAREAAALAIAESEVAAANVANVAATELAAYQERLAECELSLSAIRSQDESSQARIAQLEASHAEAMDHLQSIRSRLEASPAPNHASPPAPPPSESEADPSHPETPPPAEPSPPERRRAHRWI